MKPPPPVPGESARLADLDASGLLFSPAEERFDRITRLASHALETPMALVTLVGETRQFFKSAQGIDGTDTPREHAFCAHALTAGDRLVVEDATADERFVGNPFVTGDAHIRAYAGSVIRSPSGQPLGTLCVIDTKPRKFSEEELACLADLAAIAQAEIARSGSDPQSAYVRSLDEEARREQLDPDTRLFNHDGMVGLLLDLARRCEEEGGTFSIVLLRLPQLRGLGSRFGEETAARVAREVSTLLLRALAEREALGRYDAETFLAILPGVDGAAAQTRAQRLREAVTAKSVKAGPVGVHLAAAASVSSWKPGASLAQMLEAAAASF